MLLWEEPLVAIFVMKRKMSQGLFSLYTVTLLTKLYHLILALCMGCLIYWYANLEVCSGIKSDLSYLVSMVLGCFRSVIFLCSLLTDIHFSVKQVST
jgi:hypothetical protein